MSISESLTKIGYQTFRYCSSLTSVTIPNSVNVIDVGAFANCSSLTSVTIPNSVTEIWGHAFAWCSCLPSVRIPKSVTVISDQAFLLCESLKEIYAFPTTPPRAYESAFKEVPIDAVVYVPRGCISLYRTAEGWNYFTDFREMESGIDDVETDAEEGPAEYYNLNGTRVGGDCLAPGVYIKRQGEKASKVLVK